MIVSCAGQVAEGHPSGKKLAILAHDLPTPISMEDRGVVDVPRADGAKEIPSNSGARENMYNLCGIPLP